MAKLVVTTLHSHEELEMAVDDAYEIPSPIEARSGGSWFYFSGSDGSQLAIHGSNVLSIVLTAS